MLVGENAEAPARLKNNGPRQVEIGTVEFIGDPGPFSIVGVSHERLDPGEACEITVRATPLVAGFTVARLAVEFANSGEREVRDVRIIECIVSANWPEGCLSTPVTFGKRLAKLLWPGSKPKR